MKAEKKSSRRKFLRNSVLSLAAFTIVPRHVLGGKGFVAPSDKVNVAIVGAGGQSMFSIRELLKLNDVQLTSVVDPANHWKNDILYSADSGRGPIKKYIEDHYSANGATNKLAEYEDFRVMLEKDRSVDAVVCCTPDNTHAHISITAMRAGKHVYCEKPMAHNIWESRQMRKVAKETGMATQMGNQLHSQDNARKTVEYLKSGVIGKVHEVHSWVSATRWLPDLNGYPKGTSAIPSGFNWDLWLGPTPFLPYHEVYTPVKWRDFWVLGCGALGDFGCHDMDVATWAFDLDNPESVVIHPAGNRGSSVIAPYGEIGYYQFGTRGDQPPLKLVWYSGGLLPSLPDMVSNDVVLANRGAMYIGEKGVILTNGGARGEIEIFPESLKQTLKPPTPFIPRSPGHHREWIDAIKGGPSAMSNFDYAARLTELTLLGVLSLRLGGKKILWDSASMKAIGLPEADDIIREPVRKGWEMAGI